MIQGVLIRAMKEGLREPRFPCLVPGVLPIFNTTHKKLKANWVQ
jgi:hypothetical protein